MAPIKAILELSQVAWGMLPADSMARAGERVLDVTEQRVARGAAPLPGSFAGQ